MQRTYYEILTVAPDAPAEEIRRQFRELARKHHPDVAKDKSSGHQAFVQISEAYQVLNDPAKRADYDLKLRDQERRRQAQAAAAARAAAGAAPRSGSPGGAHGSATSHTTTRDRPGPRPGATSIRDVPVLLKHANQAYARGRFKDAVHLCETILKADPRNGVAYNILGDIYRGQRRVDKAIEMYSMAIQMNPRDATAEAKLNRLLAQERPAGAPAEASEPAARRGARPETTRRRLNQRMLVLSAGLSLALFFLMILTNVHSPPLEGVPLISQWTGPMLWVMALDGAILGATLALAGLLRRMDDELIFAALSRGVGGGVPIGLLLFVSGAIFFYLAAALYVIVAAMQDSFSASIARLFGVTLALVGIIAVLSPEARMQVLLLGGNVVFTAMLAGWLLGDLFRPTWA